MSDGFTIPINVVSNLAQVVQEIPALEKAVADAQKTIQKTAEDAAKRVADAAKQTKKEITALEEGIAAAYSKYEKQAKDLPNAKPSRDMLAIKQMESELKGRMDPTNLSKYQSELVKVTAELKKYKEEVASAYHQTKLLLDAQAAFGKAAYNQSKAIIDATAANKAFNASEYKTLKTLQLQNAQIKQEIDARYEIGKARLKTSTEASKLNDAEYQAALRLNERNKATREAIIETERLAIAYEKLKKEADQYRAGPARAQNPAGFVGSQKPANKADLALMQLESKHAKDMLLLLPKMRHEKERLEEMNGLGFRTLRAQVIQEKERLAVLDRMARLSARSQMRDEITQLKTLASDEKQRLAPLEAALRLKEKLAELDARQVTKPLREEVMQRQSKEKIDNAPLSARLRLEERLAELTAKKALIGTDEYKQVSALTLAEKKRNAVLSVKENLEIHLAKLQERKDPANRAAIRQVKTLESEERRQLANLNEQLRLKEAIAKVDAQTANRPLKEELVRKQTQEKINNAPLIEKAKLEERLAVLKARQSLQNTKEAEEIRALSAAETRRKAVLSERERLETRLAVLRERQAPAMQALIRQVKELEAAERRAAAASQSFVSSLTGLDQMNASLRAGLTALGASFGMYTSATILAASSTYALITAIRSTIAVGMEFETEYARVGAVMQLTEQQLSTVKDTAMELAASSRYSSTQVMQAFREMGMAGLKYQEAMAGIRAVLSLASIGNMDFSRATDIATNVTYGFGLETERLTHVVDVMAKTVTSSNQDIEQLGNTMSYAAPVASSFGVSLELTAAMTEVLANSGIKASRAGTALRRTLTALFSESEGVRAQLGELGVYVNSLASDMDQELLRVLKELNKATLGATHNTGNLVKAVGLYAAPGFLKLVAAADDSVRSLEEIYKATKDVEGAAFAMQKRIEDTLAVDFENFTSSLEAIKQRIFDLYSDDMRNMVKELTSYTAALANNADAIQKLADSLERYLGVIAKLAGALSGLAVLGATLKLLQRLASSLKEVWKGASLAGERVTAMGRAFSGLRFLMSASWLGAIATTAYLLKEMYDTLTQVDRIEVDPLRSPNFITAEQSLREDLGYSGSQRISIANEGRAVRLYENKLAIEELKKEIDLNEEQLLQAGKDLILAKDRKKATEALGQAIVDLYEKQMALRDRLAAKEADQVNGLRKLLEDELVQLELRAIRLPAEIKIKQDSLDKLKQQLENSAQEARDAFDYAFSDEFWAKIGYRAYSFWNKSSGFPEFFANEVLDVFAEVARAAKDPGKAWEDVSEGIANKIGGGLKGALRDWFVSWRTSEISDEVSAHTGEVAALEEEYSGLGKQIAEVTGKIKEMNLAATQYSATDLDAFRVAISPHIEAVNARQAARKKVLDSGRTEQQELEDVRRSIKEFEGLNMQLVVAANKALDAKRRMDELAPNEEDVKRLTGADLDEYRAMEKIIKDLDALVAKSNDGLAAYRANLETEAEIIERLRKAERESSDAAVTKITENLKLRGKLIAAQNIERKKALDALPPYLRALQQENWAIEDSNALQLKLADTLEALGQTKAAAQIRNEAELRNTIESQRALVKLTQTYADLDKKIEQASRRASIMSGFRSEILEATAEASYMRDQLANAGLLDAAIDGFDATPSIDRIESVKNQAGTMLAQMDTELEDYSSSFRDTTTQAFTDLSTRISEIVSQIKEELESLRGLTLDLRVLAPPPRIGGEVGEVPFSPVRPGQPVPNEEKLLRDLAAGAPEVGIPADPSVPVTRSEPYSIPQEILDDQEKLDLFFEMRQAKVPVYEAEAMVLGIITKEAAKAEDALARVAEEAERVKQASVAVPGDQQNKIKELGEGYDRKQALRFEALEQYIAKQKEFMTTGYETLEQQEEQAKQLERIKTRYQDATQAVTELNAAREYEIATSILAREQIPDEIRYRKIDTEQAALYNSELQKARAAYDGAYSAALAYEMEMQRLNEARLRFEGEGADQIKKKFFDMEEVEILERYRDAIAEAGNEWDRYRRELEKASDLQKLYIQAADQLAATLVDGAMQGKIAWEDFGRTLLRMLAQLAMNQIFISLISGIGGLFSGGGLGAGADGSGSLSGWHSTGVIPQGANGGIMKGPRSGYPAVLHGSEAVVPLPDGRSIPVEWNGAQQASAPVINVTVNTLPGTSANVQSDGQGGLTVDIVRAVLADDARRGGVPWVNALSQRSKAGR